MAPWVLISAAYAKTIQEMYSSGEEDGLMMTIPLGTNRWLDRSIQDGEESPKRGPITSAQMGGHIWLDGEDIDLTENQTKSELDEKLVANIKKTGSLIKEQVEHQLSHPHMLSTAAQNSLFTTFMSFVNAPAKETEGEEVR